MYIIVFCLALGGCKDRYDLPVHPSDQSMLVVEGFLNSGQGATVIRLSRVLNVKDTPRFKPELQAQVLVEGADNSTYALTEAGNGQYISHQLPLANNQQYRLYIKTVNGKEYQSAYVVPKKTPAIDTINWKHEDGGVRISVNTKDPSNNTRYYQWDYEETWEIHSYFPAVYKWESVSIVVPMSPNENTFYCWKHSNSTAILIGSSARLEADVIVDNPLLHIPRSSEKFGVRYSILVKQYALTKEAYEFLQLMKKNTESLGSIFDPQPSELRGNIHCLTDPNELVIGYLTASSVEEKRIFITRAQAGGTFKIDCESISILNDPDTIKAWMPAFLPYDAVMSPRGISRYLISTQQCVDCRKRGGLLIKPSYW